MIVTFDAGIYISAIQFKGVPLAALIHALAVDDLATCDELENEVLRVMLEKFGHPPKSTRADLSEFLFNAFRASITGKISGICRDPNDDYLLECALTVGSKLIVTGDKDLLALNAWHDIEMMTPRAYLDAAYRRDQ